MQRPWGSPTAPRCSCRCVFPHQTQHALFLHVYQKHSSSPVQVFVSACDSDIIWQLSPDSLSFLMHHSVHVWPALQHRLSTVTVFPWRERCAGCTSCVKRELYMAWEYETDRQNGKEAPLLEHFDEILLTPLANLFIKTIDASSISQSADPGSSFPVVYIDFVHHVV